MKILGILSLLLLTTSSASCRRISRQDLGDGAPEELSNLADPREEKVENTDRSFELEGFDGTKTGAEILQEVTGVPAQLEPTSRTPFDYQGKLDSPISKKRIQKMLKKAIIQIITGDLTTADMSLLKSLNYDAEQVRMIREEEFKKRRNHQDAILKKQKPRNRADDGHQKSNPEPDWRDISSESLPARGNADVYDSYNKQATLDYEIAAENLESSNGSWTDSLPEYDDRMKSSTDELPDNGESLQPKVVFTISYNDSEFDSSSEENPRRSTGEENPQSGLNGTGNNFPAAVTPANSSPAPVDDQIDTFSELWNITGNYFSTTEDPVEDNDVNSRTIPTVKKTEDTKSTVNGTERFRYENSEKTFEDVFLSVAALSSTTETPDVTNDSTSNENRTVLSTKYKGLRWVQDNVYQVIPEYIDSLQSEIMENDTSDSSYDDALYQNLDDVVIKNLTISEDLVSVDDGMTNDAPDSSQLPRSIANLTAHQQMANIREAQNISPFITSQKQKFMDEILARVLLVTRRVNSTKNSSQPRAEKLATFLPTCEVPRNANAELWQDPYSMNMQFQLNLTSEQHLVAAKLRIYKLPQENATATSSTIIDGVENEEKKIRISVYYYTKMLRKHNGAIKKRLMDSKVASLTATGQHLALDVKDAVRHWRSSTRNKNHGLVVLVEDQEGRPLQPSHYIQTANCHNITDSDIQDEKTNVSLHSSFEPVLVTFAS